MARSRTSLATLLALAALASPAAGQQPQRRPIDPSQLPRWTDAGGYVWDPGMLGEIQDGSTDTFDGGFQLTLQGSSIDMLVSQAAAMGDFGRVFGLEGETLVIGPLPMQGGVEFTERVGLTPDRRGIRYVMTFRNGGHAEVDINVRYLHDLGITCTGTETEPAQQGEGVWAITMRQDSMRCTVVHMYGDGRTGGMEIGQGRAPDEVTTTFPSVRVPPQATVSIAHFGFQLPPESSGRDLLSSFSVGEALADLDPQLRGTIVNVAGGGRRSAVSLAKEEGVDLLTLRSGSLLKGQLLTDAIAVRCAVGTLTVPVAELDGLLRREEGAPGVLIANLDGQVFSGELITEELSFKLGSRTVAVPLAKVESLSCRAVAPAEEEQDGEAAQARWIALVAGDRWRIESLTTPLTFVTRYGSIRLDSSGLGHLDLRPRGASVHRLTLSNGSTVSGVVAEREVGAKLADGRAVTVPLARALWLGTDGPGEPAPVIGAFHVTGLGDDRLVGTIPRDVELRLATELGPVSLAFGEVRSVTRLSEQTARVRVVLWSGSALDGEVSTPFTLHLDGQTRLEVDPLSCALLEQPEPALAPEQEAEVTRTIQMLDAGAFDVRERAHAALLEMGPSIRPYLRQALKNPEISFEQRERLASILANLDRR